VKGASKEKGTPVIVHENKNAVNQQWDFTPEGYLVSRASGLVLDIPQAKYENGHQVHIWEKKGASNQLWTWDDYGFIASKGNPEFVLDLDRDDNRLIIYKRHPLQ
jgi:hypothetical protein